MVNRFNQNVPVSTFRLNRLTMQCLINYRCLQIFPHQNIKLISIRDVTDVRKIRIRRIRIFTAKPVGFRMRIRI
jgi:hypothetical protein